jgi:Asp-tRNA(Asn)/Glu-tRNA(Gln) amidotransferase A subunit family amidase
MQQPKLARRKLLKIISALGVGSAAFARALTALAQDRPKITEEMVKQAEWVAGLELDDEKRKMMVEDLNRRAASYERIRKIAIDNSVPPAVWFHPAQAAPPAGKPANELRWKPARVARPAEPDDLAFASAATLASLIRNRQISSVELTNFYLERLTEHNALLNCVVTYTSDLAMKQAEQADREIAAGRWRGPLHGIPWGAKDLLAVPGYPTTWGAPPYKDQVRPEKAAVVERLEQAGAVLIAKLALGSLALGDVWFGGTTKNPWNLKQGSSGSSAGSASATAAGLVGFAIGTETLGSIVSPCTRCGATGLRPTFGRVSRYGAMALAWTMDKIGPITRSVEDCALVFHAIHGADPKDPTTVDRGFEWPPKRDVKALRIGYVQALFDEDRSRNIQNEEQKKLAQESQEFDRRTLEVLKGLGIKLIPIKLPDTYPVNDIRFILDAEAAAAFDDLTRSGRDAQLVRHGAGSWPNTFRKGQLIPAVEYIRANRIRWLVMQEMEKLMADIDVYVAPSFGGTSLLLTNLTGHPQVVLPNGFRAGDGTPTSIVFTGRLYGEAEALAVAHVYQQATDFHKKRPTLQPPPETEKK